MARRVKTIEREREENNLTPFNEANCRLKSTLYNIWIAMLLQWDEYNVFLVEIAFLHYTPTIIPFMNEWKPKSTFSWLSFFLSSLNCFHIVSLPFMNYIYLQPLYSPLCVTSSWSHFHSYCWFALLFASTRSIASLTLCRNSFRRWYCIVKTYDLEKRKGIGSEVRFRYASNRSFNRFLASYVTLFSSSLMMFQNKERDGEKVLQERASYASNPMMW